MKNLLLLLILLLASLSLFSAPASAATTSLRYPIIELGYCRDAKECFLYCEIPANKAACWSYGTYKLGPQVLGTTTLTPQEKAAMEAKAKELGITFPIAELGNCAGPQECRDFCEQPGNHTTCMNFAKSRGLDRGGGGDQAKEQEILTAAQSELGCTTKESCFRICEQDRSRCEAFARRHGLSQEGAGQSGPSGADREKLLDDARSELGCTSMESCSQVCQQNPKRCEEFARKHGFGGASSQEQYQRSFSGSPAPGGCDSEASCKAYCQSHPSECSGFGGTAPSSGGNYQGSGGSYPSQSSGSYVGPSGCRTQEECEAYCKANPSSCPGFREGQQQQYQQGQYPISPYPQPTGTYQPPPTGAYPQPTP